MRPLRLTEHAANKLGVILGILTVIALVFVAWSYRLRPERDDSWQTLTVGQGLLGVSFDPTGQLVAAGGWDDTVTVWSVKDGRRLHALHGHTDRIYDVVFSPDGGRVASGSKDATARIWSTSDWKLLATITGHRDRVMALAFSPDGRSLVTGSRDNSLKFWNSTSYKEVKALQPRSGFIAAVAFAPDGHAVVFGDWNGNVKVWRPATGAVQEISGPGPRIRDVAWSPDGRTLGAVSGAPDETVFGGGLGEVRLFDAATGAELALLREHRRGATAIAFSPDAQTFATGGGDGVIDLWSLQTHAARRRLVGHSAGVSSLAYSPDARLLASASEDGTVRIWRIHDELMLHSSR